MADGLPEGFTIDEPTKSGLPEGFTIDEPQGVLGQIGSAALDVAKQVPSGLVAGAEGVAAAPAVLTGLAGKAVDYFFPTDKEKVQEQENLKRLIAENRRGGIQQYLPEPETTAGKYARTVSEFVPAAVGSSAASVPGAIARQAVIPGIASEAAGQVAQQLAPEYEPYARTAAALATGITRPKKGVFLDAEGLQNAVKENYAHPAVQALELKGPAMTQMASSLARKVEETVPPSQAPGTFEIISKLGGMDQSRRRLTDFINQKYAFSEGPSVPLAEVETLRRQLNTIRTTYSPQSGTDRLAANIAVRELDNWMANVKQSQVAAGDAREAVRYLKEARANAAAGFRAEDVSNRFQSALLRAERTNSGHNVENAIRQNISTILEPKNKKLRLGWTDEQLAMARKIVSPGFKGNIIREFGNIFGGHLGVWGSAAGAIGAAYAGHPNEALMVAATFPVGRGLKALGNRMVKKKTEALERSLINTSPEGKAWAAQQAARPDVGGSPLFLQGATYTQPLQDVGYKSGGYVKVGKTSVQYGKGMRSSHCGICKYYIAGDKCQRVEGAIRPQDWCKLFEKGASRVGRLQAGGVAMSSGVPVGPDGLPIDQGPPPAPPPVPVSEPPPVEPGIQAIHDQLMAGPPPDVLGTGDPWSSVGGPPGGEYSAVLTDPNVLGYFHVDQFGIVTPKVMPPQRTDFQNPLGYTQSDWKQPEQGGFFTISDLYDRVDRDLPGLFQAGSNLPSTNNWRLIPGGAPGTVMRNGQIVRMGPEAESGLPAGVDTSFSDTAESGVAGIHRRVALGLGTPWGYPGIYRSGLYWPGGPIMGYERWPYATNVKRGGRVGRLQDGGEVPPPEDTAPPPLQGVDPRIQQAWDTGLLSSLGFTQNQGILSGPADYWTPGSSQPEAAVSSGISIDATGAPTQAGPTPLLQSMLTNSLAQADAFGQSAPSDPRVDAFYQANPGATLDDMWKAIPNAGVGSPLGGVGTLHNQEIRDYFNDMRGGAAGDPSAASILAQSPFYAGQDAASTNNWQLLPPMYRQPGMIARNSFIINPATWASDRGFAAGMNPQGGPSAEQGNIVPFIGFGTGARFGYPGLYGAYYGGPATVGWPGAMTPWMPLESGAMGGGAKRGGLVP